MSAAGHAAGRGDVFCAALGLLEREICVSSCGTVIGRGFMLGGARAGSGRPKAGTKSRLRHRFRHAWSARPTAHFTAVPVAADPVIALPVFADQVAACLGSRVAPRPLRTMRPRANAQGPVMRHSCHLDLVRNSKSHVTFGNIDIRATSRTHPREYPVQILRNSPRRGMFQGVVPATQMSQIVRTRRPTKGRVDRVINIAPGEGGSAAREPTVEVSRAQESSLLR